MQKKAYISLTCSGSANSTGNTVSTHNHNYVLQVDTITVKSQNHWIHKLAFQQTILPSLIAPPPPSLSSLPLPTQLTICVHIIPQAHRTYHKVSFIQHKTPHTHNTRSTERLVERESPTIGPQHGGQVRLAVSHSPPLTRSQATKRSILNAQSKHTSQTEPKKRNAYTPYLCLAQRNHFIHKKCRLGILNPDVPTRHSTRKEKHPFRL